MCPDAGELSAYLDGEVPSPWKEIIEEHLEVCPACRERMKAMDSLSHLLQMDLSVPAVSEDKLDELLVRAHQRHDEKDVFHKRINIPMPIAAAAVFLITGLLGINLFQGMRTDSTAPIMAEGYSENEVLLADLNQLEEIIEGNQEMHNMIVELPESGDFMFLGDSQLIKAVDFQGYEAR